MWPGIVAFFARPLVKLLAPFVALLLIAGLCWGVYALVHHAGYVEGDADARAELVPQLTAAQAARDTAVGANKELSAAMAKLKALYAAQSAAVAALEQREQAAKARAASAKLQALRNERALTARIAVLQLQLERPAATRQEAVEEADRILHDLAVHRVEATK
jgi:hypothetical protein